MMMLACQNCHTIILTLESCRYAIRPFQRCDFVLARLGAEVLATSTFEKSATCAPSGHGSALACRFGRVVG
jgi:hypothetical protein